MLRLSFQTAKRSDEVLSDAEEFFQKQGLDTCERAADSVQLENGGGYVRVQVANGEQDGREVTLLTQEWEYQVKEFAAQYSRK